MRAIIYSRFSFLVKAQIMKSCGQFSQSIAIPQFAVIVRSCPLACARYKNRIFLREAKLAISLCVPNIKNSSTHTQAQYGALQNLPPPLLASMEKSRDRQFLLFHFFQFSSQAEMYFFQTIIILCGFGIVISGATNIFVHRHNWGCS